MLPDPRFSESYDFVAAYDPELPLPPSGETSIHVNGESYSLGEFEVTGAKSTPVYGWNFLRWLFGRPKYWNVTYSFEKKRN